MSILVGIDLAANADRIKTCRPPSAEKSV